MKNLISFFGIVVGSLLLASCSGISHVIDDDVYVSKTPIITSTKELNDETSFENYRFAQDNNSSSSIFMRRARFSNSMFYWGANNFNSTSSFHNPYSNFHDPYSYMYGYYPYQEYYWMSGNYNYVTNASLYRMNNGNFDNFFWMGGSNNFALINYSNNYFPAGTNFGVLGNNSTIQNYHQGPRNSFGGINSNNRSNVSGMKGIAVKPSGNTNTSASKSHRTEISARSGISSSTRSNYTSKEVARGTGLSSNNRTVSSKSTARSSDNSSTSAGRSGAISSQGSTRISSRQGSTSITGGSTRSNVGSGTTRSGSGSGSTQGRRGGN